MSIMSVRRYSAFVLIMLIGFFGSCTAWGLDICSPDGKINLNFDVQDTGTPVYSLTYGGQTIVGQSVLGLNVTPAWTGGFQFVRSTQKSVNQIRQPLYGEQATVPDVYNQTIVTLQEAGADNEAGARTLEIEFRVYNEGAAFRYRLVGTGEKFQSVDSELTSFAFPSETLCWPISWTEATFPEDPVAIKTVQGNICPPLTVRTPSGAFASVMEANVVSYPRWSLNWKENALQVRLASKANLTRKADLASKADNSQNTSTNVCDTAVFTSPWRLVMIASNEGQLIENQYMIYNLSPECKIADTSWVRPGKTISNEMNCSINTKDLKSLVDFAAENNIRYIQIDWGWYGTEWTYTEAECDEWARNNPERAKDPTWRENTKANPYRVAEGVVPYFPRFKSSTFVDLDMQELIRYGRQKGVGLCLYINDRVIKTNDIDKLFAEYHRWGLAGLKPGFVAYGSQTSTDQIRYLVQTAAKHNLWLCIHDAHLPEGMSREYPNLMTSEGGGGQEGNHPDYHDVVLPFTRCLAGSFDYTPAYYIPGKSKAHQLSLLTTIYNPTPVIRSAWRIRNNHSGDAFGSEQEFFARAEVTFVQSKVLDAAIGKHVVIARQTKDGSWQLGATNGSKPYTAEIALNFLDPDTEYRLTLWTDDLAAGANYRPTVKTVKTVRSTEIITLPMASAGGAVAIFEKLTSDNPK